MASISGRPLIVITVGVIILIVNLPLPNISGSSEIPYEWPEAEPENYGIDVSPLEATISRGQTMPFLRSILVIRDGVLVVEEYFNDGTRNSPFTLYSASKSFTSALIGIAFREGVFESLDQKLIDFFPEYFTPDLDPRKKNITLRHLLTMRAGFNFNDSADEWIAHVKASDWVQYAIELPLLHTPGEDWHYSTPQTNLLSAVLTRAANMSTREFAEKHLFTPLQISIRHWHQDPQGYYTGGHEMYFVPRDMARLGFLYLNKGVIDGKEIVPSDWVHQSLQDYAGGRVDEGMRSAFYEKTGYGFQWWLQKFVGYETFSARGHGGQFIFCIPELDAVVVTTASGTVFDTYPNQFRQMIDLITAIMLTIDEDYTKQSENTPGLEIVASFILIVLIANSRRRGRKKVIG
ncbi:MAG: serine hydrolase domain-containing protein [Candidatus Heimdallarchaeota archaeon]